MADQPIQRWMRTSETRKYLGGVSFRKLKKLEREMGLPRPVDIGGVHMYDKAEVDLWMQSLRKYEGCEE